MLPTSISTTLVPLSMVTTVIKPPFFIDGDFQSKIINYICRLDLYSFLNYISYQSCMLSSYFVKKRLSWLPGHIIEEQSCKLIKVLSEALLKTFLFRRKAAPFSGYFFYIFNHPMIYQICDVMMSISTRERVHLWIYVLNNKSLSHQILPINIFKKCHG